MVRERRQIGFLLLSMRADALPSDLVLAAGPICSYKTLHGIGVLKSNDCLVASENNELKARETCFT